MIEVTPSMSQVEENDGLFGPQTYQELRDDIENVIGRELNWKEKLKLRLSFRSSSIENSSGEIIGSGYKANVPDEYTEKLAEKFREDAEYQEIANAMLADTQPTIPKVKDVEQIDEESHPIKPEKSKEKKRNDGGLRVALTSLALSTVICSGVVGNVLNRNSAEVQPLRDRSVLVDDDSNRLNLDDSPTPTATLEFIATSDQSEDQNEVFDQGDLVTAESSLPTFSSISQVDDTDIQDSPDNIVTPDRLSEYEAELSASFDSILQGTEIGFVMQRYDEEGNLQFEYTHNQDDIKPVASTFKIFAAYHYFLNTPMSEWQKGPGSDVYNAVVNSDNPDTGNILDSVARRNGSPAESIVLFNNTLQEMGMRNSGLVAWTYGASEGDYDPRFNNKLGTFFGENYEVYQPFTTQDLAIGMQFLANAENDPRWEVDPQFREAIITTREIAEVKSGRTSTLERTFNESWGREGVLGSEAFGASVNTQARVIPLPDGGYTIITYQAVGNTDALSNLNNFLITGVTNQINYSAPEVVSAGN